MKLTTDQQFAACHLVVALNSPALVELLAKDAAPRSPLLAGARLRFHEAVSPNFIDLENNRKVLVQQATELMDMLVPKAVQAKILKSLRVKNLDSVESIITPGRDWFFNGPRGLGMNTEWFNTIAASGAPRGMQHKLNDIVDKLTKLRAVISVMRYEDRGVSCESATNGLLMSFLDKAVPLISDYHNDCLTHDRDLIVNNLSLGLTTFIAIKANGWGTWAADSLSELQILRQQWDAVFEVSAKAVKQVSTGLKAAA